MTSAADPTATLTELAARLSVSAQALCDLRSLGRDPWRFPVGRTLRFRANEVEAWLILRPTVGAREEGP